MQVYKTFFKVAKKYTGGCLVYLAVFLFLMVGMSYLSSNDTNNKFVASTVKFTVIDEDNEITQYDEYWADGIDDVLITYNWENVILPLLKIIY